MADLYEALRKKLDAMSTGYPVTKSGQEIKILKTLFSQEDAILFLEMTSVPETPEQAGARLGKNPRHLADRLESMSQRGLMMRTRENSGVFYSIIPFLVGIMEFQVKRLQYDKELASRIGIFGGEGFIESLQKYDTVHQRTIPINKEIVAKVPVAPYEDIVKMLETQDRIAVAPCVCRVMSKTNGTMRCGKAIETCLILGAASEFYIENNMGRYISMDEALSILKIIDEEALVLQPVNSKEAGLICACCGDCCGMLLSSKMHPKPANVTKSSYFAVINEEECIGCERCIERCQMRAIYLNIDERAVIDLDRCIGCGLCVTKCPSEALSLERKNDEDIYEPPDTPAEMYLKMARDRGVLEKIEFKR